jgi:uncharacterized protein (TIGR03437 family)
MVETPAGKREKPHQPSAARPNVNGMARRSSRRYTRTGNHHPILSNQEEVVKVNLHRVALLACFIAAVSPARAQSPLLGSNLIVNGDAESGAAGADFAHPVASIPNWAKGGSGSVTVVPYTLTKYLTSTDQSPANRGFQYFGGAGYPAAVTLSQDIDVSAAASSIAGGNIKYTLSGYLGSSNPSDYFGTTQLAAAFKTAAGQTITTANLGPVFFPGNGISLQQTLGLVPTATAKITVTLSFVGINGGNGAADSLSLVLTPLDTSPGLVLGHNLVVNGGAEVGPNAPHTSVTTYIPNWSVTNGATVAPYGGTGWIAPTDAGAPDRGVNVFCGLAALVSSSMYEDLDVSAAASLIDAGNVTFEVSAWLGRVGAIGGPTLKYTFFDWGDPARQLAPTAQLVGSGFPSATSMVLASHSDVLPKGTRRVRIEVDFPANGSLADNIAFTLAGPGGPPVITPGGIVSAGAFGGFSAIAPGSWIEIYGFNLAGSTRNWSGDDFHNNVGPTTLGDVTSVSIGGKPAFIDFVSPGQVNALVPSDAPTGPTLITLGNASGKTDNYGIYVNQTQPGFLAPVSFAINNRQFVAAILPDGSFALPANAITGVLSRPAKPGEVLTIYGVGFGPVTGGFTAGTIVTAQNALTAQFQVTFGANTNATVTYDGLAPSFTGLYQFNVTVPNIAANNAMPLSFTLGGVKGVQSLFIAVGN